MLKAGHIHRYGITGIWDTYCSLDSLYSGGGRDPMFDVDSLIGDIGAEYSDVTVAICANGGCIIQLIQFKTKMGYDKYMSDGLVIFDDRQ